MLRDNDGVGRGAFGLSQSTGRWNGFRSEVGEVTEYHASPLVYHPRGWCVGMNQRLPQAQIRSIFRSEEL